MRTATCSSSACSAERRRFDRAVLVLIVLVAATFALARGARAKAPLRAPLPGLTLDETHRVGAPSETGRLTVFPIYASSQEDLGDFVTLQEALDAGTAEVREMGPDAVAPAPNPAPEPEVQQRETRSARSTPRAIRPSQQVQVAGGVGGARVNQLVIENRGEKPILVLAGTVVKGGRQDRQIGQDFVVAPKQTVPVDAFCVEHGRWTGTREGKATGGKFVAVGALAQKEVRTAGQHEKSQAKVWEQVAEVNAKAGQKTDTGTLMATLDAAEVKKRQKKLAGDAARVLAAAPRPDAVVGLAWAIDGEVQGVRWFASHGVYERFAPTLLETAAMEAATAPGDGEGAAETSAKDVRAFVQAFAAARAKEQRDTGSANVNGYYETEEGFKAECRLKGKKARPVTVDFSAK